MDELLTWSPKDLLGHFRKVDTTVKTPERLQIISDWYHDGGVLILGYEMFRSLYENKTTAKRRAPLNEEDHKTVKDQLLNGPNIIVADEAHKMKNANSAIAQSTAQFRSKSRIALTGSPLANNVAEYHTMIDWVAPNYLGPALEFRVKYVEPIQDGLWHDSTASDRRRSLKMLGVLKEDLAPKVHRADMSVLRNDLPPKKEFVITVPLTDLQRKVYSLYVQSMVSGQTKEVSQTTVWHWLAILSLLCNHPECFNRKLNERKEEARKERGVLSGSISRTGTDQATDQSTDQAEIIAAELNAPVWKVGVSQELINAVTEVFKQEASDLKAINLSNKVKILCQILDASKEAGDKVLVFSQSLHTLDFLEHLCITQGRKYARLDGSTTISKRQESTKAFNVSNTELYLISTAAGGLGLNIFGANRVVIFDFKFNPIMEEQAVGRAYRIGQKKPVFVYRFVAGGTFEDSIHNKAVFKMQLASRVVDKKSPVAWASKRVREFLFEPKFVEQKDLSEFVGMDPLVLDKVLASQTGSSTIRAIVQTDTFEQDDQDKLTAEEEVEVKRMLSDEKLKRSNPRAFQELIQKRNALQLDQQMGQTPGMLTNLSAVSKAPSYLRVPTIERSASFTDHSPILNPPRQSSLTGASNSSLSGSPIGAPSFVPPVVTPPDDAAQTSASANAENKTSRDPFHFTRGRSPITGAHTRVRSVSSVDAEDRPVPVLRTELPHRSPILGAHTKIRSASPKDRPAPVLGTELAHRSLITGAHTRARSVSSVSSDSAEDRPVPVPRTELPHRSPILGAHTKIRSASPKDRPAPVLGTELAHRSRSISPEFGMSNYSQLSNKHPSGVTPNSDQRRRKQKVGNLPTAPQKMENLFVDVLKKAYESSFESVFEPLQTATMVSKGILEALADYSTEDTIKSFVEKAAAALRANKDKCQALADLRITPRSFVRSIVKPSRMLRSSSSGSAFADIKEVCFSRDSPFYIPPFRSRSPTASSKEIIAEAKESGVVTLQDKLSVSPPTSKLRNDQVGPPQLKPRQFQLWYPRELRHYLRRHNYSTQGDRAELISRCEDIRTSGH
jgi:superfamily II DNA or RNA helicase